MTRYTFTKGFTLAEVLITLGIIGVVAAMTLPSLIGKTNKRETSARLKKFNSMMYQVVMLSEQENGPAETWSSETNDTDIEAYFAKYLAPYMKYTKTSLTPKDSENPSSRNMLDVYLNDGSWFRMSKGTCVDVNFDTNGDSLPNRQGVDKFNFLLCGSNITEWCNGKHWCTYWYTFQKTRDQRLNACKSSPYFCSSLLEYDNWEFKEDYPFR